SEPRFLDRAGNDYRTFDLVAGQRFSSPTIDNGDPLNDQGVPASYSNLLTNPGFESGTTVWTANVGATVRTGTPAPFAGGSYFFAATSAQGFAEQVIDLQGFGFTPTQLDSQDLVVVFGGRVRAFDETPRDQ